MKRAQIYSQYNLHILTIDSNILKNPLVHILKNSVYLLILHWVFSVMDSWGSQRGEAPLIVPWPTLIFQKSINRAHFPSFLKITFPSKWQEEDTEEELEELVGPLTSKISPLRTSQLAQETSRTLLDSQATPPKAYSR